MVMDLSQFLLLLLSLGPVVYLFFLKCIMKNNSHINATKKFAFEKQRPVPGTKGWPLIGETLDYFSKVRKGVPSKFVIDRMKKYSSKIFLTSLIGQRMVIICNADGNKLLFSNEKKLVQVWWPSTINKIFPKSEDKPSSEHSNMLRNHLRVVFKTDALREYIGTMDAVTRKHLQTDWSCKQVKVGDMVKRYLLTLAGNIFLRIDDDAGKIDKLGKGMEDIEAGIFAMPFNLPGTALNHAIKSAKVMLKEVEATVRQRRTNLSGHRSFSSKDFMSNLLLATNDNGQLFGDEDIASHLVGLLLASYTTMHSTITNVMKYLAELPDVYESVLREQKGIADVKQPNDTLSWEDLRKMKYTWSVICEVLRILTPGIGSFREAITDFTYEGFTIPKGSKIHWMYHTTHKNPEYFPEPDKFDPSRFHGDGPIPYTFVAFGGGPRMCPGHEYAKIVMLIFVHYVVTQFRWEKIIPDEEIIYYPASIPAQGLPIRLYPHIL